MKNFIFGVILLSSLNFSYSQKIKIGYIDSNELLSAMPERAEAEKKLQEYAKELQNQLQAMTAEHDSKVQDFQSKQAMMTDVIKQTKIKEISDLEQRIQDFQTQAQLDLQKKEQELMQPMIDKAKKAIKEVAKENGYTYILDAASGIILFADESENILPIVKKKMGLN